MAGIDRADIGIVIGYRSDMFTVSGVTYFHNEIWEQKNMFYSLTMAEEWLKSEPCIVCYSDVVFSPTLIRALTECEDDLALTYYTDFWELWQARMDDPLLDLETFKLTKDGRHLEEIGKKPTCREEIQGQYIGLIRFTPESWQWVRRTIGHPLPKPVAKLDMTTLLLGSLEDGCPISALPISELWLECDTEKDIEVYEKIYGKIL